MSERKSVARAPGRCGILGNPSDIYGGKVLSCSVPAYATCTISDSDEWVLPEDTRLWDATQVRFKIPGPVKVDWHTDVPRSSGLSGSTALLAATLASLLQYRGESPDLSTVESRSNFAELVRVVERFDSNIVCGYQDAYMIVHGHFQLMDFAGKHPIDGGPHATLKHMEAPLPFLLVTTGVERLSASVHGPLGERWMAGEPLVRESIEEISHLAEPGAERLLQGDYAQFGKAMDRNHELVAGMGGSGDAIDLLISRCKAHGAHGAKLAGAGLGGTVIALTEDADALETNLRQDGYTRFLRPKPVPGLALI